jgi:cell division protein FtsB
MSVGSNIWDSLYRLALWLLAIAAVVAVILWYVPVVQKNEAMRRTIYQLEKQVQQEQELSKVLDARLRSLQDPRTVERLARERLSFAKPGELIFHFEAPKTDR